METNILERSASDEYCEVLPIPFLSLDMEGTILTLSTSAAELLGKPRSSLKDRNLYDFLNRDQKLELHHLLTEAHLAKGKTIIGNLGETLEIHASSAKSQGALAINFLMIDKRSIKEKENVIAAIFHDIRTPMTSVMLAAQMLKSNGLKPEKRTRLFEIMTDELNRTDGMIRALLNMAKKKSALKEGLPLSWCNFREIALNCIETMNELQNYERDVFFIFDGECFSGYYNKESLLRITENLINNARKYGCKENKVTVTLEDLGQSLRLKVHNFGEPIPETELSRIFKVFHRCKEAIHGPHAGWGLGLSLVHDLVKLHNGTIEVSSSREDGTTFTIELPKEPLSFS